MLSTKIAISSMSLLLGATAISSSPDVTALLKTRLPKTQVTAVDCERIEGLCEVTTNENLFYVDESARYLIIGRVYDMETRQDLTAARLLELNPDMLVGGAAKANALANAGEEAGGGRGTRSERTLASAPAQKVDLSSLSDKGTIVWGRGGDKVTVFSDFRCGYCRALTQQLEQMNVTVIERPISVLGSRDLADRVLCAKDQRGALRAAYAQEPVKPASCDTQGLDENEAFARRHGFTGTPVLVRSDGAVLEGYRPKEALIAWLKGA
ncbi:MAG: DsbC family protein [Erythrobacter sp.]